MRTTWKLLIGLLLAAGVALLGSPAHAAPAAPAAPAAHAVKAVPSVTPAWCADNVLNYKVPATDGSGNVVRANAVEGSQYYLYSQSGASVTLDIAYYRALDGHIYNISLHRWQKQGGTVYNGTTGQVTNVTKNWSTPQNLWLTVATPTPSYILAGWDINRPAVGFRLEILPCA